MFHVTLATEGRFALTDPLAIVATIVRVCGDLLLLFAVVDDHVHLVMIGDRFTVGRRVSGLVRALGLDFAPARVRPVADRSHLRSLVGYVAGQPRHHGAGTWDATCLPDLLGARRMGFDLGPLAAQLPRENLASLALEGARFDVRAIVPASDALVLSHGPVKGYRAALATAGLTARGERTALRVEVDRAWRQLARAVGLRREARDAAGIAERTWQRMANEPADPSRVDAIRRRIAYDVLLTAQGRVSRRA